MDLEDIVLGEISQSQKGLILYDFTYMKHFVVVSVAEMCLTF